MSGSAKPDLCGVSRRGFSPGVVNGALEAPSQQVQSLEYAQGLVGSCLWPLAKAALHSDAEVTQGTASLGVRLAAAALAPILNAQIGYCRDVHQSLDSCIYVARSSLDCS